MRRHLVCAAGGLGGLALGVAAVAYASSTDPIAAAVSGDPTYDLIAHLVSGGGLPAVLAVLGWWLRGLLGSGLPITISFAEEDRRRIDRLLRHLDRDDSESDEPPPPKAAA